MYSVIQKDYFIFFSNFPGLVLGIYYAINSMVLLALENRGRPPTNEYRMLEISLVAGPLIYSILTLIVGIILPADEQNTGRVLVAIFTNCCTVLYYASPLTTMYHVINEKDSSSLHPPMLFANLSNSCMWLVYGIFALNDPFVYGPNGIGASLAILQLSLSFIYPRKDPEPSLSMSRKDSLLDSGIPSYSHNEGRRKASLGSFSIESNHV
jgi:hypothetical protein